MKVRFLDLAPRLEQRRFLTPDAPVARFQLADGEEATVMARDACPFRDLEQYVVWPAPARATLLRGLLSEVREADRSSSDPTRLDVARRFHVHPHTDSPEWRLEGFRSLNTVDGHVVKHLLGVGERDPAAAISFWSMALAIPIDAPALLRSLEALGCIAWKGLAHEDPERSVPIALYRSLPRAQVAACVQLLAPLRERYMRALADAVRATAELPSARHAHLGTVGDRTMHFLDGRGVTVIAKGPDSGLVIASGFLALADGESELGVVTLRRRWDRLLQDVRAAPSTFAIHSPMRWKVPG